jgi:thiosulfate sulfurtransferase
MIPQINPENAIELIGSSAQFVDIRDPDSFASAHIKNARHLDQTSLPMFLADVPLNTQIVVYCYHGHSSLSATEFLLEQGYKDVSSLQGGFEFWRQRFPETLAPE